MEQTPSRARIEELFPEGAACDLTGQWAEAAHAWLQTRRSPNTREAYWLGLRDFLQCVPRSLWEVTPNEVRAWMQMMQARGLAPATISLRMAALSSLYRYASEKHWVLGAEGTAHPLHSQNPVLAVDRPEVVPFRKATYMTVDEVQRFLDVIPRGTRQGKRDYALFLAYLLTGRRSKEIRTLTWGDLRHRDDVVLYHWENKGNERWDELPQPAWQALQGYLEAAGRWGRMEASDYLFTPLSDRATRLPTVDVEDWTRNKALTGKEVGRLLKRYAHSAGIQGDLHVHTLRHTAAELYRAVGMGIYDVSKLLGHSGVEVTRVYFDHLEGYHNTTWQQVAQRLELDAAD